MLQRRRTSGTTSGYGAESKKKKSSSNHLRPLLASSTSKKYNSKSRSSSVKKGVIMMETARNTSNGTTNNGDEEGTASLPTLGYPELVLGRVIGRGGFSIVTEIREINLQDVFDTSTEETRLRQALANTIRDKDNDSLRYVLKTLRTDLPEDEHTKGIVDLAVEARFLATLSHPNIITMRATANSDPLESKYFVVLDRLLTTLEHKLTSWRRDIGQAMGVWFGPCIGHLCANKQILHRLWIDRLLVARDIAAAVRYLHNQDIVYRDLKPDNVGFNHEGEVKIFDFGLAKRLHPDDKNADDLYMLTGNTGSLRYMAPEVAKGQPYDTRVDAYSFGILFWQICALATPYAGYSCNMHADYVVEKGYRPKTDSSWPYTWTQMMKQCWSSDVYSRPDFEHIVRELDEEIEEMLREEEDDDHVIPRRMRDVRARKKKSFKIKARRDNKKLDVDTRLSSKFGRGGNEEIRRSHDVDIV